MKRMKNRHGVRFLAAVVSALLLLTSVGTVAFAEDLFSYTETFGTDVETMPTWIAKGWYGNNFPEYTTAKVAEGKMHFTRDPLNKSGGFLAWKSGHTGLTGVIEIGFELTVTGNIVNTGYIYSPNFMQIGNLSTNRSVLGTSGTKLMAGNHQGTMLTNAINDGQPHAVRILYDRDADTAAVSLDGGTAVTIEVNLGTTPFTGIMMQPMFSGMEDNVHDEPTNVDVAVDNFSVKQIGVPRLSSASVTDGAKDVSLTRSLSLYFSVPMDADSAQGITLTKDGEAVDTTIRAFGSTIDVDHAALDPLTDYTLTVPATVASADGMTLGEAVSYQFTTGKAAKTTYEVNFNDFTNDEKASPGAVIGATKAKLGADWTVAYTTRAGGQIRSASSEGNAGIHWDGDADKPKVLDGDKNNVLIENGQLMMKRNWEKPEGVTESAGDRNFMMWLSAAKSTGGVRIRFDMELPADFKGWNTSFIQLDANGTSNAPFSMGFNGKKLCYQGTSTNWQDEELSTNFGAGRHSFDLLMNLDTDKVRIILDGSDCGVKDMKDKPLQYIVFFHKTSTTTQSMDYALDNLSIEILDPLDVTNADTLTAVDVKRGITLEFNHMLGDVEGITLQDSTGANTPFTGTVSADGYRYTLRPAAALAGDSEYKVKLPALTAANGMAMAAKDVTVTTASAPTSLRYESHNVTGNLVAGENITVSASFKNVSTKTQKMWLGVALYRADGSLEKIACADKQIASGATDTTETSFAVPQDIGANPYLRLFAWDGAQGMQPICEKLVYPAQ